MLPIYLAFIFLSLANLFNYDLEYYNFEMGRYSSKTGNLIESISEDDLGQFQWMNAPDKFSISDGTLRIQAGDSTDFFNDPSSTNKNANAPFLYTEIEGDFVATTKVTPDFSSVWNACALFLYMDEDHWGKLCFENSDATGPSIVTVVTKSVSDDSNGVVLDNQNTIWLRIARKGQVFAMYWSKDNKTYKMSRLFKLKEVEKVKIGMEAQCPVGHSVVHTFSYFSLESRTVEDLRKGE